MANIILSKESSSNELKGYFEAVLKLSQSDNEFPINLDDVWMLAYSNKGNAVRTLKINFIEGIDYNLFQNEKVIKSTEIRNGITVSYMLSTSCLEYFIARKVRPVFDVYRQVFHKTANMMARKEIVYVEREENTKKIKEQEKKIKELEEEVWEAKARLEIKNEMLQTEMDLKNSCFGFLVQQRLYEQWQKFKENENLKQTVARLKDDYRRQHLTPYELPF